jgi:uncharacterized protein (DUF58 family)
MQAPQPIVPPEISARAFVHRRLGFAGTPRFFIVLLLGLVCLVPAWWAPQLILAMFFWDFLAAAAFVWDFQHLPRPREIEARRVWEEAPCIALRSRVLIWLRNLSGTAIRVTLLDETPASFRDVPPEIDLSVPPYAPAHGSYQILPRERGDSRFGRLFLRYQSSLGFAERWAAADLSQTVRVLPDLKQARKHALYLIRSRQVELEKRRRRQRGQGREFESLREYRQGDDLRDLCWTATARRHQLTTRIFQIERSQAVWIVLDAGRLLRARVRLESTAPELSKLDLAVNAALSLAQVATQCGDRVGVLAYGRQIQQQVPVGRSSHHLRTIVEALAQVRGEVSEASHSRAARVLLTEQGRRSLVVWITDFAETPTTPEVIEYAMQMTQRHVVVFSVISQIDLNALAETTPQTVEEMYRHAAALEIAHRRDILLRSLRQRGVFALELLPGLLASSLVNQYLDVKERSVL